MSDQPQAQPRTCAVCGSPLEPDDRFCRFCGAPVPEPVAPSDPDQETRQAPVVEAADSELWLPPSAAPEVEAVEVSEEVLIEPAEPTSDAGDLWAPVSAAPASAVTESAVIEETIYASEPPGSPVDEPSFAAAPQPIDVPTPSSEMPYVAQPVEQSAGGSNRMWWIIGGIVLFFFLVCCCMALGIAIVANGDTGFQEEMRGTAGLLVAML